MREIQKNNEGPAKQVHVEQGVLNKKTTDPDVVGWFLGGQKSTRVGQYLFRFFSIVILKSFHRETPKTRKIGFGFFGSIVLQKTFDKVFCKTFFVVF
jgi:hypothetical protein